MLQGGYIIILHIWKGISWTFVSQTVAAEHLNVYCKMSGLVESAQESPAPDDVGYYTPTLDILWEAFGEDRLVYESNWPVSERFADYATVQRIVTEYFSTKGQEATEKYFWKNAKAAYNWFFTFGICGAYGCTWFRQME